MNQPQLSWRHLFSSHSNCIVTPIPLGETRTPKKKKKKKRLWEEIQKREYRETEKKYCLLSEGRIHGEKGGKSAIMGYNVLSANLVDELGPPGWRKAEGPL